MKCATENETRENGARRQQANERHGELHGATEHLDEFEFELTRGAVEIAAGNASYDDAD